jgi:lipopolysaccharide transport system ATP-binding protein
MEDVAAKDGRTVLFVSHNLAAMQSLCKTGILLEHGRVAAVGTIQSVSEKYSVSSTVAHPRGRKDFAAEDHPGKIREARILALSTTDAAGACRGEFLAGEALAVVIEFESHTSLPQGVLGCQVRTSQGVPLFTSYSSDGGSIQEIRPGRHAWVCHIDLNPLMPGVYFLECGVANRSVHVIDLKTDELSFEILDKPGFRRQPIEGRAGPLYLDFRWRAKP